MRKLFLAAAATVAIAAPAAARDGSGYVGIEGGVLKPQSQDIFGSVDFTNPLTTDIARSNVIRSTSPPWTRRKPAVSMVSRPIAPGAASANGRRLVSTSCGL